MTISRASLAATLLVLASAAAAAPAPAFAPPRSGEPYWFKTYSTAPYKELWSAELAVADYARDLPKALTAVEKAGGKLTQPLGNFASSKKDEVQQLSFTLPRRNSDALVKSLRKLGAMGDPLVRAAGAPIPLAEVKKKIDLLMKEKAERAAELAKTPATAAAAEEILEHLLLVEEVARREDAEILFDLQVRRK